MKKGDITKYVLFALAIVFFIAAVIITCSKTQPTQDVITSTIQYSMGVQTLPEPVTDGFFDNINFTELKTVLIEVVTGVGAAVTAIMGLVTYIRKKLENKKDDEKISKQTQELKEHIENLINKKDGE